MPAKTMPKRKQDAPAEVTPDDKLQEFLEVMQPPSKSKVWANEGRVELMNAKEEHQKVPKDQHSVANPGSIDGPAPKKLKRKHQDLGTVPALAPTWRPTAPNVSDPPHLDDLDADKEDLSAQADQKVTGPKSMVSDADWLRSRTSRLLGLVEDRPSEGDTAGEINGMEQQPVKPSNVESPNPPDVLLREDDSVGQDFVSPGQSYTNPEIESIRTTGRLFVRNLPYGTSKDELREYFSSQETTPEASSIPFVESYRHFSNTL